MGRVLHELGGEGDGGVDLVGRPPGKALGVDEVVGGQSLTGVARRLDGGGGRNSVGSVPKVSRPAMVGQSTPPSSRSVTRVLRRRSSQGMAGERPKKASSRWRLRWSTVAARTGCSSNTYSRPRCWNRRASSGGVRSRLVEPTRR